jgi:hypothetical protein
MFGIQYVINVSPNTIFPSTDIFFWVGLFVGAIAAFYTALVLEFYLNPNFRPPVTLYLVFLAFFLGAIDYLTISLAKLFWIAFGTSIIGAGFVILTIPSLISSVLNWWMDRRSYGMGVLRLSMAFMFSPYLWAIGLGILLSALHYVIVL